MVKKDGSLCGSYVVVTKGDHFKGNLLAQHQHGEDLWQCWRSRDGIGYYFGINNKITSWGTSPLSEEQLEAMADYCDRINREINHEQD